MKRLYVLLILIFGTLALGRYADAQQQELLKTNYTGPNESIMTSLAVASSIPETKITPKPRRIAYTKSTPLNCVSTLKASNLLPKGPVTLDGYARTIPAKPLELKEGEKAVIKTKEGWTGHVLQVVKKGDQYISTVEGGHPVGVGRVVPSSVILGEVNL